MALSTIVISEYNQVQSIVDIITTGNFKTRAFNYDDAVEVSNIAFHLGKTQRGNNSGQAEYKDDIKLIAQAVQGKIDFIITEDDSTLAKYCGRLNIGSIITCKSIVLKDGFDKSTFEGGQVSLL